MLFSDTNENRSLADATIARLKADARMVNTKASLFKIGGYSAFLVCLSLGCSSVFLGYASIKPAQSSSEEIATILAKTISNATITTKGELTLHPDTLLVLKPDQMLLLDPYASVKVEPSGVIQNQDLNLRSDPLTNSAQPKSGGNALTSYTVFKEVNYAKGVVVTAWIFSSNESATPDRQRCYYSGKANSSSEILVTDLAIDGQIVSHARGRQIDTQTAAKNCVWFNELKGA